MERRVPLLLALDGRGGSRRSRETEWVEALAFQNGLKRRFF